VLKLPSLLSTPLLLAGLAAAGWLAFEVSRRSGAAPGASVSSQRGPRIEDIRQVAELAVLRVQVSDVIEGRNAGGQALVLVHGDADVAVDWSQARLASRDDAARRLIIEAPAPAPRRARVDHERTRIYEIRKTGLAAWNPWADPRTELLADCMRAAQSAVEAAVSREACVAQARDRAERLLRDYHRALGWDAELRWTDAAPLVSGVE
jgi:hypothetical protein